MTRRERFWRFLVRLLFGPRIACHWFGHLEQVWTSSSSHGSWFNCEACGYEKELRGKGE